MVDFLYVLFVLFDLLVELRDLRVLVRNHVFQPADFQLEPVHQLTRVDEILSQRFVLSLQLVDHQELLARLSALALHELRFNFEVALLVLPDELLDLKGLLVHFVLHFLLELIHLQGLAVVALI